LGDPRTLCPQEDSDEEDFDDDDSEDSELKRQRKEEAKLKELMAEAEKELAEKWAKATFWSELKAMIPYTKEYREEQAELREMSEENSISVSHTMLMQHTPTHMIFPPRDASQPILMWLLMYVFV
jgi:methanogenic corrinoid protein MtbC1